MKRILDIILSLTGLLVIAPFLLVAMLLVWLQDFKSPFYIAPRVGKDNKIFQMVKLRSMVVNADKSGVDSTAATDPRITLIGKVIRKFKLDELTQLWNVLLGDMSFVGPRPNVERETRHYTKAEQKLLSVKPGITDFSSIVFSDEGDILADKEDPDLSYNQLIRPWKSRLGIIYVDKSSVILDLKLIIYTVIAIVKKDLVLKLIYKELSKFNIEPKLLEIVTREKELYPYFPPESTN